MEAIGASNQDTDVGDSKVNLSSGVDSAAHLPGQDVLTAIPGYAVSIAVSATRICTYVE